MTLGLVILILTGCAGVPTAMGTIDRPRSDTLLVLLPGRGDDADAFEREGFLEMLRDSGSTADHVTIDARKSLGRQHQFDRELLHRVVRPARRAGYRRIYLAGVSQGGFRVLSFLRRYGHEVDGGVAFAPFLGPRYYVEDIRRQGGLDTWSTDEQQGWWTFGFYMWSSAHDVEGLWRWAQTRGHHDTPVHIGWGHADSFADAASLFSESLPEHHRLATAGGHEWETWRRLWSEFLRRDPYGLTATAPENPLASSSQNG
jgi:alpha-beta hydrolase superfamily lysophospholipase